MKINLPALIITLVLFAAIGKPAKAQYILTAADASYQLFNYSKAIDLYEQAYKKKNTIYAARRLAECNAFTRNYQQAESWYAIAVNMKGTVPEDQLGYARALQNNSKYGQAKAAYQQYIALNNTDSKEQQDLWLQSCDSAIKWMKNPEPVVVKNEFSLNSPESDWAVVKYNDAMVYTSDRNYQHRDNAQSGPFLKFDGAKAPDKNTYGWTGNRYLRLYIKANNADSSLLFPLNAGTDYHVGAASFSGDGNELFFTLTKIPKALQYNKDKLATVNIELYSSKKDKITNTWSAPEAFKYNNANKWSVGDPFLTPDGQTLFFVSNMPGGRGGTDLYVTHRAGDGTWGTPINLIDINTENNERSPFFDSTGKNFYFSSDGYPGMGGLDIFKTANRDGKMDVPKNMGYPVNSPRDDFSFTLNTAGSGYLASDRSGGLGEDDIYSFSPQPAVIFKLEGIAFDKKTNAPLANVIVSLSQDNGSILNAETGNDGSFKFNLAKNADYNLWAVKSDYMAASASPLTTNGLTQSVVLKRDLYLEPVVIGKAIRLENIYYDFDKADIRADAAAELNKLVKFMQDNPTVWIELGSHTDSRGNDSYNLKLSQQRAESAVQYIISRGIARNRIAAKGYGETQLLNRCGNDVECTEAEHQLNRRTEFKIVKQ